MAEKETISTEIPEKPPGCTCGEFMTAPCPIHSVPDKSADPQNFGEVITTVTDNFIIPERMREWAGFVFRCPNCGLDSIMVNNDTAPTGIAVCINPACAKKAFIKSAIVTDFVKKLTEERKTGRIQ